MLVGGEFRSPDGLRHRLLLPEYIPVLPLGMPLSIDGLRAFVLFVHVLDSPGRRCGYSCTGNFLSR